MKKFFMIFIMLCCLSFTTKAENSNFNGVWVSSVFNMDYPSAQNLSSAQLKKEADDIIKHTKSMGLNAIVLQVRPCGDSLYPSKIFPWSVYISGKQGVAPPDNFDPLAYFIKQAHAQSIEVHAWCNPYRVTKSAVKTKADALAMLAPSHPAVKNPDDVIFHTDGNLYFDPGLPQNRTLITQGIIEIVENYDIDGIHLDDYFYPGAGFDDTASFAQYGKDSKSIDDFRRNNVNILIEGIYNSVKSVRKTVDFGISPFGIWANKSSHPEGSDTVGGQSYYQHYADTKKWVKDGIIDYICPQLYWPIGADEGEFTTLLNWWQDTTRGTKVKLYIGLGAYRLEGAEQDSPWYGTDMLEKQISLSDSRSEGMIFFRYRSLIDNMALKTLLPLSLNSEQPLKSYSLSVSRPMDNIKTALSEFYITGASDFSKGLTLNGETIFSRSLSGFFGVLVPLEMGENHFVFESGGDKKEVIITRSSGKAFIWEASLSGHITAPSGDEITLVCRANSRARVSVFINDKLINLKNYYDGTFRTIIKLPEGQYSNLIYFVSLDGVVKPIFTHDTVTILPESTVITGTVTTPYCDIYPTAIPADGASGFLKRDMKFNIANLGNGMAYVPNMGYVSTADIEISTGKKIKPMSVKGIDASQNGGQMTVDFALSGTPAAWCSIADGEIRLGVSPLSAPVIFEHDFFTSVTAEKRGEMVVYTLVPKSDYKLGGVDIMPTAGGFQLIINPRVRPESGLKGVKILLDAGHGGSAAGAMGADVDYPEKRGNLDMALELEKQLTALGAVVTLTRQNDGDIDLKTRMAQAYNQKPHVFLSLHSNSAADNVNIGELSGVELYFRGSLAQPLVSAMAAEIEKSGRTCLQKPENMLYLCRGTICPSILIENEYIPNPSGLEKIMSPAHRTVLCAAICQGLTEYFS